MLKNYLKIALRNLKRHRIYSFISMSSLSLGLGLFILFALLSYSFSNFDTFHNRAEDIYGVVQEFPAGVDGEQHSAITPPPLMEALLAEFPEIEEATRFIPPGRMVIKYKDKVFYESGIRFVDPNFLSFFTFRMKSGDAEEVLTRPYSLVLTEESATKYFGEKDPIGETLTLDNKVDVTVTGVTEDVPNNSSIRYSFLVSIETAQALFDWTKDWKVNNSSLYLLLSETADKAGLEEKFPAFVHKYFPESKDSPKGLYLFPLLDIFLKGDKIDSYWASGQISFTFWIIPVLLLFVACINFMNLSTARYALRAREVGLRKVVGAHRFQLIKQFLGEAVVLAFFSLPFAVILYELIHPLFTAITGDSMNFMLWDKPQIIGLILGVTFLTGIIAGSYPALYLSVFKPVKVLKGNLQMGKKGGRLRKILVVVQFAFSIILIVTTIVSIKQLDFNFKVDLGFDRTQIIAVETAAEAQRNLEVFKRELIRDKNIVAVSAVRSLPVEWDPKARVLPQGTDEDETWNMNYYGVDYGFIELAGLSVTDGRSFSRDFDDRNSYILNETAVQQLNWENPLGKTLTIGENKGTVIGIVEDYHFKSLYFEGITPSILYLEQDDLNYMFIKYASPENRSEVLASVKNQWNILAPDLPFEHVFLEDYFQDYYKSGDKTAEMSALIGGIAIFLSLLGLFGLSSYSVERKKREIGIRKVLGATVSGILRMLFKEFALLLVIANVVALPLSYFLMQSMIRFMFVYPMSMGVSIFLITALLTMILAFLAVFSLTLRAARANPVDSIRYE